MDPCHVPPALTASTASSFPCYPTLPHTASLPCPYRPCPQPHRLHRPNPPPTTLTASTASTASLFLALTHRLTTKRETPYHHEGRTPQRANYKQCLMQTVLDALCKVPCAKCLERIFSMMRGSCSKLLAGLAMIDMTPRRHEERTQNRRSRHVLGHHEHNWCGWARPPSDGQASARSEALIMLVMQIFRFTWMCIYKCIIYVYIIMESNYPWAQDSPRDRESYRILCFLAILVRWQRVSANCGPMRFHPRHRCSHCPAFF